MFLHRQIWRAAFLILVLLGLGTVPARAQDSGKIYIDVGQASVKKSLLALPPLSYFSSQPSNPAHLNAGQELFKTIANDLAVSSFFTIINQEAYLEDSSKTGLKPAPGDPKGFNFQNWKAIGAEFLIRGGYRINGNTLSFEVYAYHVPQAKTVMGKTYESNLSGVRRIGHSFANDLVKALTGKRGAFLTKVVASHTAAGSSHKEIVVMDWDGTGMERVSNHKSVAISPAWDPNGKKIAYTAFAYHPKAKTRNADLFMYDLGSARRWLVSWRTGLNSGASFLPDGSGLLLTLSEGGGFDIFRMSLDGKSLNRLTRGPNKAMNVESAVSPDGRRVAFSSDRHGRPMIYVMDLDGGNVKRITYAGYYNASPSWSPDGKMLAFAGYDKTHFDIFVVNVDGTGLKRLTDARLPNGRPADNEDPSFSPDGRMIMFSSNRSGNKQLYVVSPDGLNERRITFDRDNYEKPKWGPFLD